MHASLRRAVEHGVLVADQATGRFASATRCSPRRSTRTLLPGERETAHARLAGNWLGPTRPPRRGARAALGGGGRAPEALVASIAAAREAEAVFGLAEALAHLERALALWAALPDAAALAGLDLAELCSGPPSTPS